MLAWNEIANGLIVVLKKLHLDIEKSDSPNDGQAKGGSENHFAKHLFLLDFFSVLRQNQYL